MPKTFIKRVPASDLLSMFGSKPLDVQFHKNKIKVLDTDRKDCDLNEGMSNVENVDFRFVRGTETSRIIIPLRSKFDACMSHNRVLKDCELFPMLKSVPEDYKLYVENYQAEISI